MNRLFTRRGLIGSGIAIGAGGLVGGCDRLGESPTFRKILSCGEAMNRHAQRLLTDRNALAREFSVAEISPFFRGNGSQNPGTGGYPAHAAAGFADWRVSVSGLVARPLTLSMAQIRSMPRRSQITRHDCVEGWSAIGKWTGVPLSRLLDQAGMIDRARFIVFRCADRIGDVPYYESIDLVDALHPQTIMAWALNDRLLPIRNGAPLRLRVERQLGYKHAKYVQSIEAVASLDGIGLGKGGFWEDRVDYEWYAGI
ncbi:molybdopterin-dependent oxidoreductase [Sphingomonas sp. LaA6.9]|uniref:molybdopterin-dependent oxidoreductase n=1 Tax=Sphingomonas sp. LaA6.9 TaxID=2919914 RepID=UPI00387E31AC